eukprot:TRINITY_DN7167_c0_g1_i1.p1 TRINITY_DN7167_c0_g1~~TRINITY_DN7167_c0_g1_i1.p1  ORF type:complete len:614 (+),score=141.52 TRINITY_DN7167_c0_g1_i1:270-2111(+)
MTLTHEEIEDYTKVFKEFDANGDGRITSNELQTIMGKLGEKTTGIECRELIKQVDTDGNGTIEINEFLKAMEIHKQSGKETGFSGVVKKTSTVHKIGGYGGGETSHSYSEEEKIAFVDWINGTMKKDADLKDRIPMSEADDSLFKACHDGILLCKLINDAVPETIDERVINKTKLNVYRITENQILTINSAKAIGCNVVNIGAQDLIEGRPYLIMGIIWQIIKLGLFARINLRNHPELYRLLEYGETIEDLLKLPSEEILLRWFNYHLKAAGSPRRVKNFSNDIKDSEAYTILLKQIAPKSANVDTRALSEGNHEKRAAMVLDNADKIGCKKFVRPRDIVNGNQKLNLAFVANLFNTHPALEPLEEKPELIVEETREEKTFRNWMNSLGVEPFVNHLYEDLRDGLVFIQLFEKVQPGIVDQKRVNYPPWKAMGAEMKKLENDNYAVELGKKMKFSLVGIDGKNIYDRNKMLVLSIVWQLMRAYVLGILQALSSDGKPISYAVFCLKKKTKLQGSGKPTISGFKDSSLVNAHPIIHLVEAIHPGTVDFSLVKPGGIHADNLLNAKYAVSSARKIGAVVFALPEDIVELKPKMLLTIFAALMASDLGVAPASHKG